MLTTNESKGLALARGFIVLIMPAVHTTLLYSTADVKRGPLGILLGFLAEQPGAQLFMFMMGIFIAYGRQKSFAEVIRRVFYLLMAAYLLNFIRLVLPFYCGWLPNEFLTGNNVVIDGHTPIRLLLTGDILQLAAIAYFVCQGFMQLKQTFFALSAGIILILLVSPMLWPIQTKNPLLQNILGLFNGLPPTVFFPVFPWLCYPVAGVLAGFLWQKYLTASKTVAWLSSTVIIITAGLVLATFEPVKWNSNFYRLGPGGTLFHLGAVMLWIALFVWAAKKTPANAFFRLLSWLSNHITVVYFTQWILIMWLLPVFGYEQLSVSETLFTILLTSFISFSIPALYNNIILSRKSGKNG